MESPSFHAYVANINRMHLIELIETCQRDVSPRCFRASLVENPVTGQPYPQAPRASD